MSICRVFSCVVGRGCLLWLVHSFGKSLLAFALLHFVFQGQTCLLLQVSLDHLLLHSSPLGWKGHSFQVLVLKGLIGLHRTIQLHLFWHYWLGHRLGLLWSCMVWLGNEQRSFCHFWDWTQVLHFELFCWLWGLLQIHLLEAYKALEKENYFLIFWWKLLIRNYDMCNGIYLVLLLSS